MIRDVLPMRMAGLLLLSLMACRQGEGSPAAEATQKEALPVRLERVTDTSVTQPVVATGVLGAKEEIPLGFKIGGVIRSIAVHPGDRVRAGQPLAWLELPEIDGAVARAEAGLAQAERDLVRAEALFRDSVIPQSAVEGARTTAAVARADAEIARFNRRYATIRAPSPGTILARYAEPGEQVAGGTPLLLLANAGTGQVLRVGLPDRDVARIALGDHARVRFATIPSEPVTGRVTQIASQTSPGTGTWSVEIRLDRTQSVAGGIASGLIGTVEILPARRAAVRLIPLGALLEGDADSAVIYAPRISGTDTLAARRRVEVAFLLDESAAIRSGLDGVRQVVTAGGAYLHEGDRIRALAPPPSGDDR